MKTTELVYEVIHSQDVAFVCSNGLECQYDSRGDKGYTEDQNNLPQGRQILSVHTGEEKTI